MKVKSTKPRFHNATLYQPGEVFEYEPPINPKTNKPFPLPADMVQVKGEVDEEAAPSEQDLLS